MSAEPVHWGQTAGDGAARCGVLHTPHGDVATPGFMPVGTRAAVRALDPADLRAVGAEMVLANTFHLMLRPGADVVEKLGGVAGFMGWGGPTLTDSGGYQVFSLDPRIAEEGARFRSPYDGAWVSLTPEGAVAIQEALGADVAMVLDVCVGLPADDEVVRRAMERTLRWSERARAAHHRGDQALFGIVQGGANPALRRISARETASLGFAGFGIGGLSVGESAAERKTALLASLPELPASAIRYVMGLGDPEGVLEAVGLGADLFDCVWPTRLARHGKVLTPDGDYHLKRAEFTTDPGPLHEGCGCATCAVHSRAYLRHLLRTGELLAHRLLTIHNLHYTLGLLNGAREAIRSAGYDEYCSEIIGRRLPRRDRARLP